MPLSNDRPIRSEHTIEEELDEELLVYLIGSSQAITLNFSAKAIWQLCDGNHSIADIAFELAEQFNQSVEVLLPDLIQAVNQLLLLGVVFVPDPEVI